MIVLFISASSISIGTNLRSRVGSFFLGRPTDIALICLVLFPVCPCPFRFYILRIRAHLLGFLILLTPSFSAFGSTVSFIILLVSRDGDFASAAFTTSPNVGGLCRWNAPLSGPFLTGWP